MISTCAPLRSTRPAEKARRVKAHLAVVLLVGALLASAPATADVYEFIAEDGTPHFSDMPTDPRFRLLLRTEGNIYRESPMPAGSSASRPRFEAEVSAAALASQMDANLLHAVIETESNYNSRAVSPKGALGLMQLLPQTARRYGVIDPFDAAQNVRGGAHHLRDLLDQFSGNKELALAAYNAGAGAVLAHGRRVPPFAETLRYVPKVLRRYNLLRSNHRALQN